MNSPEYITKFDILDNNDAYPNGNPNAGLVPRIKLFEEKNITGKNTYYQTHTAWWGGFSSQYEPSSSFYVDIDFYNPTSSTVTVYITNLAYGNEYDVMQDYYNGGKSVSITIPSHEHRLLFETLNEPLSLMHPGTPPEDWSWNRHRKPVILFDFQVSAGNVTVSSMAAYNRSNLYLRNGYENILDLTGEIIDSGEIIYNTDVNGNTIWYGNEGAPRPNETDLYGKYKGIARNQSAWINGTLNYVIDDSTPRGQPLQVNLSDPYYPDGVANPKTWWMTNINPLNDKWVGVLFGMPENQHRFTYHRDSGGIWNFAFDYRDLRHINDNATGMSSINNPVDATIIDYAKADVKSGWKEHFPDYPDDGNPDTDESRPPDEHSVGMGAWGATYHYTVTIDNTNGSDAKTVQLQAKAFDNMIYGYKAQGSSSYQTFFCNSAGNDEDDWWTPVTVPVPARSTVTFEVVTNLGGGHGGTNVRLILN